MSARPIRTASRATLGLALALIGLTGMSALPAQAATGNTATTLKQAPLHAAHARTAAKRSTWTPRPEQYPNTVTRTDLAIPMSDGTVLRGDLTLPADADGNAIATKVPVVVTITAYNKSLLANSGLGGSDGGYLVKRGYAQLTVDARGTGSSEGQWNAFDARENKDAGEIMTWAHRQSWSNGKTAMTGPSYMGISQIWAASAQPKGLKAIFPQVPGADVYRDVVASGGAIDAGFMPLWLGLVTAGGVLPPAVSMSEPQSGIGAFFSHLEGFLTFTAPVIPAAVLGAEPAYDGAFYKERSAINVVNKVKVPAFFVSGEFDLFQRGTPLLFENLSQRGVPTKMIIGPWDHLQGSSGADLPDAGHGTLEELQLRWFDHYVKGMADPTLNRDIKALTYYEQGTGAWRTSNGWVGKDRKAVSFKLSGSATTAASDGAMTTGKPKAGTADVLPVPVTGLCTRSTNQWTAGVLNSIPFDNPCLADNSYNDYGGVAFQTAPLTKSVAFQGPLNARLYISTLGGNGNLSVAVEDVAPDGTVTRLSGGWQVIAFRELNKAKSRYLDGRLIQPFHPFTKASHKNLASGKIAPVDVEIFPTAAKIKKGHQLRIAVQAFDTPHQLPTLQDLIGTLTVTTIHTGPKTPSVLTIPALG